MDEDYFTCSLESGELYVYDLPSLNFKLEKITSPKIALEKILVGGKRIQYLVDAELKNGDVSEFNSDIHKNINADLL